MSLGWTEEQDGILLELWGEGRSAGEIAKRIDGKTRNAVVGRAHRLRAAGAPVKARAMGGARIRPASTKKGARQRPYAPRSDIRRAAPLRRPLRVLEALPSPTVILKAGEVEPNGTPASLIELCGAACRWPVSPAPPHMFCNRIRRGGSPYCDEHTLKSFQPKKLEAAE